jgi:hypothetical protein
MMFHPYNDSESQQHEGAMFDDIGYVNHKKRQTGSLSFHFTLRTLAISIVSIPSQSS